MEKFRPCANIISITINIHDLLPDGQLSPNIADNKKLYLRLDSDTLEDAINKTSQFFKDIKEYVKTNHGC